MTRSQSSQPPRSSSPAAAREIYLAAVTAIGQAGFCEGNAHTIPLLAVRLTNFSREMSVRPLPSNRCLGRAMRIPVHCGRAGSPATAEHGPSGHCHRTGAREGRCADHCVVGGPAHQRQQKVGHLATAAEQVSMKAMCVKGDVQIIALLEVRLTHTGRSRTTRAGSRDLGPPRAHAWPHRLPERRGNTMAAIRKGFAIGRLPWSAWRSSALSACARRAQRWTPWTPGCSQACCSAPWCRTLSRHGR